MKNVQTRQIAVKFAKALREELSTHIQDKLLLEKVIRTANANLTLELIETLVETHKEDLMEDIMKELITVVDEGVTSEDTAYVLSPLELSDPQKVIVTKAAKDKFGENVKVDFVLDDKMSGGLLIKYRDMEIDLTAESRLKKFLHSIKN